MAFGDFPLWLLAVFHCGVWRFSILAAILAATSADCRFADAENGDWRLRRDSPFYKKGLWQARMEGAADYAGVPRVTKAGRVDIGCFETPYHSPATQVIVR